MGIWTTAAPVGYVTALEWLKTTQTSCLSFLTSWTVTLAVPPSQGSQQASMEVQPRV